MSLEITPSLKGALGELYYKEGCDQKGWAYVSLENIHNSTRFNDDHVLVFKKGFHRINVKITESVIPEILDISKPTNNSKENPSFVFDYLACKVGQKDRYDDLVVANPLGLCWVEIKTGGSTFSDNQVYALSKIKLNLSLFYISDVLAPPGKIGIEWDIKSGQEWLVELDDLKDHEEYDDEYY